MGISPFYAEAIIREHLHKPFTGTVVAIGRQTMLFAPSEALQLFKNAGMKIDVDPATLETDSETSLGGKGYISDRAFFGLFGVKQLRSLDHDAYEGADIIHDLNQQLPSNLEQIADVIIDGSTIDNVFKPAEALCSLSKMLRPGGRIISINVGSNHYNPYMIPTPGWFFDFFVVNGYADCRVYVCIYADDGAITVLALDPSLIAEDISTIKTVQSDKIIGLFVIAEKSEKTERNATPIQLHYQTKQQRADYMRKLASLRPRPDMLFSNRPFQTQVPEGYRAIFHGHAPKAMSLKLVPRVRHFMIRFYRRLRGFIRWNARAPLARQR